MPLKIDAQFLEAALEGLENRKARIESEIANVRAMLGQRTPRTNGTATEQPRKRRTLSLSARKRIAAAQRKRWAEARKAKEQASAPMRVKKPAKKKTAAKKTAVKKKTAGTEVTPATAES